MITIRFKTMAPVIAAGLLASATAAQTYRHGGLSLQHPWARETAQGQAAGGGFVTIVNGTRREDRLIGATSPVAGEVQLHTMSMDGGIMRMRQVQGGFAVPAMGTLELRPGANHIMFIGLKRRLRQGERFPVTLRFQRAGRVTVQFAVQAVGSTAPMESSHAGH